MEDLQDRLNKLKESLNIPEKRKRIEILTAHSLDPKLWDDQENARSVMQELANLTDEIAQIEELTQTLEILNEVEDEAELKRAIKNLEKLEVMSYLGGDYDSKNAIVSIHAGQGGTEAMDWVSMLHRMYLRF